MAASEAIQTISRLTPLTDVLLMIDAEVKPVTPRTIDVSAAAGRALATDAMAPARPASSLALQDGWALSSDETLGAGGYAPAPLARMPPRVEAGQAMPAGTDSIAPIDAVKVAGGVAEVLMPINPGEGVLAAGGDSDPAIPLRRAGERLTATDLAAFAAAGIARRDGARAALSRFAVARQRYHHRRGTIGLHGHRAARRRCAIRR